MIGGMAASTAANAVKAAAIPAGVLVLKVVTKNPVRPIAARAMSTPAATIYRSLFRIDTTLPLAETDTHGTASAGPVQLAPW
jgi:hypothetical protein